MEQLHNLRENLLEMYDDIHLLQNNNYGFQYCDILKELNRIHKGCEKFKHVVMKKNVLPSNFIKPIPFLENDDSEINEVIHRLNTKILKLDESLLSSKNYNDIYKFVRNLNSVERDVSKLIRFIKGNGSSQGGGGGMDAIADNVDKLSQIGKEVQNKLVETSTLIDRLEEEFNKMNPVYTEKLAQMQDVCFPKCSIAADGTWINTTRCGNKEDIAQTKKATTYFNDNRTGTQLFLDRDSKYKQVIDKSKICETDASKSVIEASSKTAASVESSSGGDCFPKCSIFNGKWVGPRECQKVEEMKKEQAARENYKNKTGTVLFQGRDDLFTVIDPQYICP